MTICIGALAADKRAVIGIADRYISFGSLGAKGDTDSVKILPLQNDVHAMIAGSDDAIARVLAKLVMHDDLGNDREKTREYCETAYREAESELLEMRHIRPFMSRDKFEEALLQQQVNSVIEGIAEAIRKDRHETEEPTFNCELILCGFDIKKEPYILTLIDPGACTDTTQNGFSAIGSGSPHALRKMFDNEWERKFPLDRALFEILDAKIEAEDDDDVGYNWDAVILTANSCTKVPEITKKMLDRTWIMLHRSPYAVFNKDEDVPLPPRNWKTRLKDFTDAILTPNPPSK
ncbi:MAG: hypothetical protein ACLPY1_20850 [Terracidiphilus sp.]